MRVQGLSTLSGHELLRDSQSLLWGYLCGLWVCPKGLDSL